MGRTVVVPCHDKPAGGQSGHSRIVLGEFGVQVDLEFAAHRIAVQIIALAEHARRTVLHAVLILTDPHDDITDLHARRIEDLGRCGVALARVGKRVDLLFLTLWQDSSVNLAVHRNADQFRAGRAAIPIRHLNRDLPQRQRIVRLVLIGQPGQNGLHRLGCRKRATQGDLERCAACAVLSYCPNDITANRHLGARHADAVAVRNAEQILRDALAGTAQLFLVQAAANDALHEDGAAIKVGRIHIGQRDCTVLIEQLRGRIHRVFVECDGLLHALEDRSHRPNGTSRLIEQRLEHTDARTVARTGGCLRGPDGGQCAVGQDGKVGLVLGRRSLFIHDKRIAVERPVRIEPLCGHARTRTVDAAGVSPCDHEPATRRADNNRVGLG